MSKRTTGSQEGREKSVRKNRILSLGADPENGTCRGKTIGVEKTITGINKFMGCCKSHQRISEKTNNHGPEKTKTTHKTTTTIKFLVTLSYASGG